MNRSRDGPRQDESHHERRQLDHQEQAADGGQQHEEERPEADLAGADSGAEELLRERGRRDTDEQVAGFLRAGGPVERIEKHHPGQTGGRRQPGRIQGVVRGQRPEGIDVDAGGGRDALLHVPIEGHIDHDGAGVRAPDPRDGANGEGPFRADRHEPRELPFTDPFG